MRDSLCQVLIAEKNRRTHCQDSSYEQELLWPYPGHVTGRP